MPTQFPLPASTSPNVRALLDALRQRRERTLADRALAERVFDAFESEEMPEVRGLHFYVFEGAISVYGAVASTAERDAVLGLLATISGATHIADHLTVLV
jgi:hypothetical protein